MYVFENDYQGSDLLESSASVKSAMLIQLSKFQMYATNYEGYNYSGTSPYGHLTKKTSQLQPPWLRPKLYSPVQVTPCNKVTSPLRSLLPSPVGDLNSEVPLYYNQHEGLFVFDTTYMGLSRIVGSSSRTGRGLCSFCITGLWSASTSWYGGIDRISARST